MDQFYFRRLGVTLYEGKTTKGLSYVLAPVKGPKSRFFGFLVPKGGLCDEVEIGGTKIPAGTAHLLEHRLFETASGDALKDFSAAGAFANAYTTQSCTFYYFLTSGGYEKPLDTLFSMLTSFFQTNEKIDREKSIVLEELASRRDDPGYALDQAIAQNLYFSSPVKEEVIGTERSLQAIHLSTVKKFFYRHYSADRITFFATGSFSPEAVEKKLSSLSLPSFEKEPVKTFEPKEDYAKVKTPFSKAPSPDGQTYLGVGIKFPSRKSLYEKFGDDLFAFYEIVESLFFSPANAGIASMRKDGLIIFQNGSAFEEAGEDGYLEAFFETEAPEELRKALEAYFPKLPSAYDSFLSPLKAIQSNYLGQASQSVGSPAEYAERLSESFLDHFAWPALAGRVMTFRRRDVTAFLKEAVSFPRTYVLLEGRKR